MMIFKAGDVLTVETGGGAGYGDSAANGPPASMEADGVEGFVTGSSSRPSAPAAADGDLDRASGARLGVDAAPGTPS